MLNMIAIPMLAKKTNGARKVSVHSSSNTIEQRTATAT